MELVIVFCPNNIDLRMIMHQIKDRSLESLYFKLGNQYRNKYGLVYFNFLVECFTGGALPNIFRKLLL